VDWSIELLELRERWVVCKVKYTFSIHIYGERDNTYITKEKGRGRTNTHTRKKQTMKELFPETYSLTWIKHAFACESLIQGCQTIREFSTRPTWDNIFLLSCHQFVIKLATTPQSTFVRKKTHKPPDLMFYEIHAYLCCMCTAWPYSSLLESRTVNAAIVLRDTSLLRQDSLTRNSNWIRKLNTRFM